jgi:hypothetical protein
MLVTNPTTPNVSSVDTVLAPDLTGTDPSPGAGSLLPDPVAQLATSGDVGAEIAALCVETGTTEEQADRTERDAVESLQEQVENKEVQDMRDKAGAILGQAIAEGVTTMAQGAMEGSSAIASLQDVTCPVSHQVVAQGTLLGMTQGMWRGAGELTSGIGRIVGGAYQAGGANDDANAAEAHAEAGHLATSVQDMHDSASQATQFVQAALDFYREYVTTQAQTRNAAVHVA